ncbi:MAG: polyphosphate polymerase domain-containing protein [Planctomycetota bacterium]
MTPSRTDGATSLSVLEPPLERDALGKPMQAPISRIDARCRYELKFAGVATLLPQMRSWLRAHPAGFAPQHADRAVNNLYFDTHDCANCADNLAGVPDRRKLRLRWYGALQEVRGATLELKEKYGGVGRKASLGPLPHVAADALLSADYRRSLLRLPVGPFAASLASMDQATLVNCYQRSYYVSRDGEVRLTLDRELRFFDQRLSARINLSRRVLHSDIIIVELKADACAWRRLAQAAEHLPLRQVAISKYCFGLMAASSRS